MNRKAGVSLVEIILGLFIAIAGVVSVILTAALIKVAWQYLFN